MGWTGRRAGATAALALTVALLTPTISPAAETVETNLKAIGHNTLHGTGLHADVAVVGTTAVVASGIVPDAGSHVERLGAVPCLTPTVKVVSLKDERKPAVVATIALPPGTAAVDVDAVDAGTASYRGDLVAIAVDDALSHGASPPCPAASQGERGVVYYDVTDPARPRLLGRACTDCTRGHHSVSLAQRADGRLVSISVESASGDVVVVDATDPWNARAVATWRPPVVADGADSGRGCRATATTHAAELYEVGRRALVAAMDRGVFDLDVSDPAAPTSRGQFAYPADDAEEGNAAFATALPVTDRTLALVSEEDWYPADCRGKGQAGAWGPLRVLELSADGEKPPQETRQLRSPRASAFPPPDAGIYAPGRAVVSGDYAFVAWHAEGLRVLDLAATPVAAVAQFIPASGPDPEGVLPDVPDVVGVALLADFVVVVDRNTGLYVLDRPEEGQEESIWEKVKLIAFIAGFMGILLLAVIPRLVMMWSMSGGSARVPAPVGARRGRQRR